MHCDGCNKVLANGIVPPEAPAISIPNYDAPDSCHICTECRDLLELDEHGQPAVHRLISDLVQAKRMAKL
jgi:hypothetical protein